MSTRLTADDATLRAGFSGQRTFDDVAKLLEVTPNQLRFHLYKAKKYKVFAIAKRSGGTRVICSPATSLKIIQHKLNQVLHAVYRGRAPVHGFARGKSIRTNAKRHRHSKALLNLDLADFFPSINFGRVKGLFQGKPYSLPEPVALVLAQVCCHERVLPQGAPTSPVMANMICARMDSELKAMALRFACAYTRYADDMTFSTLERRLPGAIAFREDGSRMWKVGQDLTDIIKKNGFLINESKTRVLNRSSGLEVTGLLINPEVNVKRRAVRQVRAMLHAWERFGEHAAEEEFQKKHDRKQRLKKNPSFRKVLRGKLEFIGFVRGGDDGVYLRLRERYARLAPDETFSTVTIGSHASDEVLAQAVWLLESDDDDPDPQQATAFAAKGYGLIRAAHAVQRPM